MDSQFSPAVIGLDSYEEHVKQTTKLSRDVLSYALLGLFGEVGSVMEAVKKREREGAAYLTFEADALEELGDALWYFTLAATERSISLSDLAREVLKSERFDVLCAATGEATAPLAQVHVYKERTSLLLESIALGRAAGGLLTMIGALGADTPGLMAEFFRCYLRAVSECGLSLAAIIEGNVRKTASRFLVTSNNTLPDFDADFPPEEQIPRQFEIEIYRRRDGLSSMRWNGVFIGDPLSDNIAEKDGYRYHDVFHLANAAILGWSPVFRALIKHKRKSDPTVDEAQDGGRAIVVEEGLTAWIFARSKQYDHFALPGGLTYDMLKVVSQFVRGYEVEACPLWLWERAILEGYKLFREVREVQTGVIVGNRDTRSVHFRPTAT